MRGGGLAGKTGVVRIGISGWRYKGWRGIFYPPKLLQRKELEFASRQFETIELNGSFYSLQTPGSFARWARETPDNFVFAVKGSRFITHMRKLREPERPLANFFAQGILELGPKLGPILWQFPPNLSFDPGRFEGFFAVLPRTFGEAKKLIRKHAENSPAVSCLADSTPLRHAVEIRHESFAGKAFLQLLRRNQIALVVADTVEWPLLLDVTADFVYCRLHGSEELYASGYEDESLRAWARRVATWAEGGEAMDGRRVCPPKKMRAKKTRAKGRDVFVYFDNDAKARAPFDARKLWEEVSELLS